MSLSIFRVYRRFPRLRPTHHAPLRRQPAHSSASVALTHFRRAQISIARRSRRNRPQFPAGSFLGGFRTPASVQAAPQRSAGIRNPQQKRTSNPVTERSCRFLPFSGAVLVPLWSYAGEALASRRSGRTSSARHVLQRAIAPPSRPAIPGQHALPSAAW